MKNERRKDGAGAPYEFMENWKMEQNQSEALVRGMALGAPVVLGLIYGGCGLRLWKKRGFGAVVSYVRPLVEIYALAGLMRRIFNRPRPFEKTGEEPLLAHKGGQAFPSRHAACGGTMVAAAARVDSRAWGPGMFLLGLICGSRVLCRLHSVWDVLAGAGLGLGYGWLRYRKR